MMNDISAPLKLWACLVGYVCPMSNNENEEDNFKPTFKEIMDGSTIGQQRGQRHCYDHGPLLQEEAKYVEEDVVEDVVLNESKDLEEHVTDHLAEDVVEVVTKNMANEVCLGYD